MAERETETKPRDARTVEAILKTMGVESYDPRVVNQLLELLYRYVSSVLNDSRMFSEHADKTSIDLDDIKLAIRSRCNFTFTQPPPRDVTMRLAAERNVVPLPSVDQKAGVALPPADFQLTAPNYQVVIDSTNATERTPQSSPKRPRLVPSPYKQTNSPPIKSPHKSPAKGLSGLRSVQSPGRMSTGSPLKRKTAEMKSPLSKGAIGNAASPGGILGSSLGSKKEPVPVEIIDIDGDKPMGSGSSGSKMPQSGVRTAAVDSDVQMTPPNGNTATGTGAQTAAQ